jgi:hypothetical protein
MDGRTYTKYEALMITLETLQSCFRSQMKHLAGLGFKVGHNNMDNIPFKLAMSNIATMITSWARELHLEAPRGSKGEMITHLSS